MAGSGQTDDRLECFLALVAPQSPELQAMSLNARKAAYFYSLGYDRPQVAALLGVKVKVISNYASRARTRLLGGGAGAVSGP